jgi:hypothetical protein
MTSVAALTVYPTRRSVDGDQISTFDQLIDPQRVDADDLTIRDFSTPDNADLSWSARLYVWPGQLRLPSWAGFLEEGFGDDLGLAPGVQNNAVIAIER